MKDQSKSMLLISTLLISTCILARPNYGAAADPGLLDAPVPFSEKRSETIPSDTEIPKDLWYSKLNSPKWRDRIKAFEAKKKDLVTPYNDTLKKRRLGDIGSKPTMVRKPPSKFVLST